MRRVSKTSSTDERRQRLQRQNVDETSVCSERCSWSWQQAIFKWDQSLFRGRPRAGPAPDVS